MGIRETGREELVAELFERLQPEAVRLAWALCRDEALARELAQEAFVRLYVHRRALRDPAAAPAYLRRTVVNLAYDAGRRRGRAQPLDPIHEPAPVPVGDRAEALDLLAAVDGLPRRRRECVVLRYYLDLSEADTAAALGISVGTVKSQTHKALHQLRDHLSEPMPEPVPEPAIADEED